MIQELLTEKLRPRKFEHLILSTRLKGALGHGKLSQNILLYGSPGTGKTSTAKILAQGYPYEYINVSDESSVDIIRTKITDFCSRISVLDNLDGESTVPMKVVILDEVDGASDQFFKAFKGTIEKFAKGTRFICTSNFVNKIPEAIQSRFEMINFDFVNKDEEEEVKLEWTNRISMLLGKLNISYTDGALSEFVGRTFPDMRSALNKIQSYSIQKITELTEDKVKELNWGFEDLYELLSKPADAYSNYEFLVSNYSSKVEDVMSSAGSEFIEWIRDKMPSKIPCIPQIIITVAHHQAQRNQVIDPCVSMLSLAFSIQKIMNP